MKVLTTLTVSGGLNMASTAKDVFTIGTPLENNDGNVDDLYVYANADFKNNVTLGSSSVDTVTINAGTFNISGAAFVNNTTTNLYVSKQGSNNNSGFTSGSALLTIQAAVDKLATLNATTNNRDVFHVTIHIASGSYQEKVNLSNKGIGKSDSNLLVKFVGEKEILYSAIPTTGALTTDPDLGFDNAVQCGVQLVFTSSTPSQDSLKGCFLISNDGYRTAVINSHSGNNFYLNSVGFGYNDIPQTVNIARPAVEVKGLFRTAGVNGAIAFDTIRVNGQDDGEDCIPFGGFSAPPTSLEYTSNNKYRSVARDEILAYNCQIMVSGTVDVVLPPNFQFINGYIFSNENSNNQRLTLTNYAQAEKLSLIGSLVENIYFSLNGYKSIDLSSTELRDNVGSISNTPVCIGPKKLKYSSVGNFITLNDVNISFPANYICKSGYLLTNGGSIVYYPDSYFIGPFNRIFDAYNTGINFYYRGNGPPTGSHFFSGSLQADRLFILNQGSYLQAQGQLDVSNVNVSGSYPLFYVYNSKMVFTHVLPITASTTSSNYLPYDIQLDDVAAYKYTDLPIANQQGSLLDNRAIYYDLKADYKIPLYAEDVTITDSITSNNGYKVNGNIVVGEVEYALPAQYYGTGSYESGSVFKDAFGTSNAEIIVGRLSSSLNNRNQDIIDIFNQNAGISVWPDGIDFYSPDGQVSLQQIISALQGGGGGGGGLNVQSSGSGQNLVADYNNNTLTLRSLTAGNNIYFNGNGGEIQINANSSGILYLQTTGSGESLVRDVNNGTGYLRSLKSTSTISVIQQTNELELAVNPNLTLTSLTSQGTLIVSGNVQLGDQSSDITTITGQLTASNGIEVGGNIVPNASASYSLGSSTKPFKEIFVGSGSISIQSPLAGVAATTITNNSGNLDISAGGVRLVGTGSFIGSGYGLYGILGANIKHTYDFLTSSGQTASAGTSVVYLNDGNNANYGLPDITNYDGIIIFMKNLKNTIAIIHPYSSQKINDVAGTHNVAGNGYEAFHAVSNSSGITWYTMYSS